MYQAVKHFESAGAVMVELECLSAPVTALITARTTLSTVSIGSGPGADVQYLFGNDILGEPGRKPRHARAFDDFAGLYARLQERRVLAFAAFRDAALGALSHRRRNRRDAGTGNHPLCRLAVHPGTVKGTYGHRYQLSTSGSNLHGLPNHL